MKNLAAINAVTVTSSNTLIIYPPGNWGGNFTNQINNAGNHYHQSQDYYANSISGIANHSHSVTTKASTTGSTGSGTSFTNLPPYITVYMYKRVK